MCTENAIFGLLQPAYQMLTVINQPIRNHRAREESVQNFRLCRDRRLTHGASVERFIDEETGLRR